MDFAPVKRQWSSQNPHTTPAIRSPNAEISNSFTKLTSFAPNAVLATSPTSTTSQPHPPYQGNNKQRTVIIPSPRTQREKSRSASQWSSNTTASALANDLPRSSEVWHLEPNTHGNRGLKNAVDRLGDHLRKKMWVDTLGPATDGFSESLRKNVDQRMWTQRSSLPDREFQNCYDEFWRQVRFLSFLIPSSRPPHARSSGYVSTKKSPMAPIPNSSTNPPLTNNTPPSTNVSRTSF
ncbi:glycosyltransferase family 20 protein [Laccaria amethystina LaAM-08-1]|uniref:Unplaced genomic scaffold K443scaffold_67, whole genome shotgun sequence n=1 Tax=Laccaria amethystina LaAM-08-1 TaxID=1095629 RepID=A0A0C9XJV6_9AGAR|nr:glycosyltransferase family 20 protein [Laccaria amethystina LaAM-08-1]